MKDHGSIVVAGHVKLAGLREDQRMKILTCARAITEAKGDRKKRRKALADMDQLLRYFENTKVLTPQESENIWYAMNRGI